jgi:pimeloyl-ACP methyl ester carboxylesterase
MIAFEWQRRYPEEILGAVLINTSMRPHNPLFQRLRPACYLPLLGALGSPLSVRERLIYRLTCGGEPAPAGLLAHWCRIQRECPVSRVNFLRQLWAAARYSTRDAGPRRPLLLLSGQGDRLVRPACSLTLARRWQVPLVVHPGAGHDLPLEDPDWVVRQIQAFRSAPVVT